jgi:hypothetical protein
VSQIDKPHHSWAAYDALQGVPMRGLGLLMVGAAMSMGAVTYQPAAATADLAFMTGC